MKRHKQWRKERANVSAAFFSRRLKLPLLENQAAPRHTLPLETAPALRHLSRLAEHKRNARGKSECSNPFLTAYESRFECIICSNEVTKQCGRLL